MQNQQHSLLLFYCHKRCPTAFPEAQILRRLLKSTELRSSEFAHPQVGLCETDTMNAEANCKATVLRERVNGAARIVTAPRLAGSSAEGDFLAFVLQRTRFVLPYNVE